MKSQPELLSEVIHRSGKRFTQQRKLVMEVLLESQEHLDADAVYARAKARQANISLATVYRTLAFLKQAGLVEENRLGEDHGHFETSPNLPHDHFTCIKCGQVIEFDSAPVRAALQTISAKKRLQITKVQLVISGLCSSCQGSK